MRIFPCPATIPAFAFDSSALGVLQPSLISGCSLSVSIYSRSVVPSAMSSIVVSLDRFFRWTNRQCTVNHLSHLNRTLRKGEAWCTGPVGHLEPDTHQNSRDRGFVLRGSIFTFPSFHPVVLYFQEIIWYIHIWYIYHLVNTSFKNKHTHHTHTHTRIMRRFRS